MRFPEYVVLMQNSKFPLQHKCSLKTPISKTTKISRLKLFLLLLKRCYIHLFMLPCNHPSTKIYYGSVDNCDFAKKSHWKSYPYILHPFCRLRAFFDTFILIPYLLLEIYLVSVPGYGLTIFKFCFTEVSYCLLICGCLYIILNFLTGYTVLRERKVVLKPRKVIKHYLLTYFIVDILNILPHVINNFFSTTAGKLDFFQIIYFLAILRMWTLWQQWRTILESWGVSRRLTSSLVLILKLTCIMHICACTASIMTEDNGTNNYDPSNYFNWKKNFSDYVNELLSVISRLYYSAYFGKQPTLIKTCIALVTVIIGAVIFSYILATVLRETFAEVAQETRYNQLANEIQNFALYEHRDPYLRNRIIHMFDVIFLGTLLREKRIKETIPDNLRRDLYSETLGVLIKKTLYLSQLDDYLLLRILDKLKLLVLLPNDSLVEQNTKVDTMYFLSSGRLLVFQNDVETAHLDDGDNLAEESLFVEEYYYNKTVIAASACYIYKLTRQDYLSILD